MPADPEASIHGAPPDARPVGWLGRAAAVAEVSIVFALAHLSYRAFKHFTALGRLEVEAGLNYTTGIVLILFAVGMVFLGGGRFADYGLTIRYWRRDLSVGLLGGLLLAGGAVLIVTLTPIPPAAFHRPDPATALASAAGMLVVTFVMLLVLKRERGVFHRCPVAWSLPILLGLLALPAVLAPWFNRPLLPELTAVGWLFACAGFGEEIFFRGYIQSRVNQAFVRPFHVLGVDFGWGLIVSSLLFGMIHVLNPVDYFGGRWDFAWWWGLGNVFAGLFFGCLREKTGSVVAVGVAHGLPDALAEILRVLSVET